MAAKKWWKKIPWWGWVLIIAAVAVIAYLKFTYIF
jgi:hypothetical protein